jgi:hypothetical protein
VAGGLGFATEVGLDGLFTRGVLGGDVPELLHHARGLVPKRMDKHLAGCAAGEGIDHVGIDDVWELIVLLGEVLDVLPEGLVSPLHAIMQVPFVFKPGVRTLEVTNEDGAEITPTTDAARLELLEPSSC